MGIGRPLAQRPRRYADRITLDFFGDQLVCHLCADVPAEAVAYPRHFGVSFARARDFDRLLRLVEHRKIFLAGPSNNVIEFKNYDDPRLRY